MTESSPATIPVTTAFDLPGMTVERDVAVRFDSSELGQQLTEILAYGTAVVASPTA